MAALSTDFFTACKRQMDMALEISEALVEAAEKAREIQLAAAVDAHAALEATRKSCECASTPAQLLEAQSHLLIGNLAKVIAYWSALAANARDTQVRIGQILGSGASVPMPPEILRGLYAVPAPKAAEKAA